VACGFTKQETDRRVTGNLYSWTMPTIKIREKMQNLQRRAGRRAALKSERVGMSRRADYGTAEMGRMVYFSLPRTDISIPRRR